MDKLLHFLAGIFIFWVASYFLACPIIPVIVIGIGKEVYNLKVKKSYMDFWDFIATVAGGLIVWAVM